MMYFYKDHINETDIMGDHSLEIFPLSRIRLIWRNTTCHMDIEKFIISFALKSIKSCYIQNKS